MKKLILLVVLLTQIASTANAQFLKKLNQKIDKATDKALGIDQSKDDKQKSLEKKQDDAQSEYSDVTENNEKPIFVDAAPTNGKMALKLKKEDRFWGGYITIIGQPKKEDSNANVLDFINARVGSFYTDGEISNYAIYFNGNRFLNDESVIPLRPEFISYDINKTPFFLSTEAQVGTPDPIAAIAAIQAKGNKPITKEDEAQFAKTLGGNITQGTFTFIHNGKTYGPYNGIAEKMLVLKSMKDGKPTEKFYGFGLESYIGEKQAGYNALIQTEKSVVRVKDGFETAITYPNGLMAMAQGNTVNTFSNGKTMAVTKVAGIEKNLYDAIAKGGKYFSDIYGTDSGHIVCFVTEIDKSNSMAKPNVQAMIDYKTLLKYPVEITRKNLLIANNPAKSILYKMHTLYYADGTKETIENVGDAQLVSFNGKEYIVWFEMMKVTDGHEIYVCQKELK